MNSPTPHDDLPAGSARLRSALDASAQSLDAATLSRLNRAWGMALAASAVLAVVLLPALQAPPLAVPSSSEEFAVIAAEVEPALLEDLEFYAWLDSQAEEDAWEG
jgi:hypothetical protein